jgi:hypothetical protein
MRGRVRGEVRGRIGSAWIIGWVSLLGLLVWSSPAEASRGHAFERSFSEPCVAEPCEGRLKEPDGVAVNEATGDIYVVDKGANRVARFTEGGTYQAEFNGSGLLPGEQKAAGGGGGAGEVETGRFVRPEGIAVDNACHLHGLTEATKPTCAEFDASNGDVYVVDAGHQVIDKYSPDGAYIGQISEGGEGAFPLPLDGVTVDRQGAVWVYLENQAILGFTNHVPNAFKPPQAKVKELEGFGLPGIAVDSTGDFYVRNTHGTDSVGRVAKVDASGKVLIEEVDSEKATAVAVEQTTNDSFIDNITTVGVFDPSGTLLERLGEEHGEKHLIGGAGIGVNASAGAFYVADSASDVVTVFGPVSPSAPTVESESVSQIASDSATLNAEIDPRSEASEAATEFHFEYGRCAGPDDCAMSGYESSAPIPDAQIAADFEVHAVGELIYGLQPNTTYHFRVVAHNGRGNALGLDSAFTTQGAGGELSLPDGRGWELVSPPDKFGAAIEPISEFGVIQASASGDAITYLANAPTESQPQGNTNQTQVLSSRDSASWASRDIAIPHSAATGLAIGPGPEYKFFSSDLSDSAVQPFGQFIPQLSGEASESTAYLHDLGASCEESCYHPLVTGKLGFANVSPGTQFGEEARCQPSGGGAGVFCGPEFLGATEDLEQVVLHSKAALKTGAGGEQLYEWAGGALSQVSVLPGEQAAPESPTPHLGLESQGARGAISADGSRIVWEAAPNLYLRDMARTETAQLDKAEASCEAKTECTSGGGRFQIASADGSTVFFTDTHRLTADSGAVSTGSNIKADLYECRIAIENSKLHCELSDVTPESGEGSADVQGGVLGASEDGSWIYFVARGVLSQQPNRKHEKALQGEPNLYVRHGVSTTFITTLSSGDSHDWAEALFEQPARVAPNGQWLAFMSQRSLTGYDNRDALSGRPTVEVYVYNGTTEALECASCDPTGARPVGVEYHQLEPGSGGLVGGPRGIWPDAALVAANVPGWTAIASGAQQKERYQPRYLNDAGRLFFNTADALVSQDANNTQDIYEYEPPGVGSCKTSSETFSARSAGCAGLISSGKSSRESAFLDASESGDDVFFLTAARLSTLDTDAALDIYDAHVCADSPCITAPASPAPPCTNEFSCKASPSPPSIFAPPPTIAYGGPGNFAALRPASPPPRKTAEQLRLERLAKALKTCRKEKAKKERQSCERSARKKYAKPKGRRSSKKKSRHDEGNK